jgi:ribosome maturation factor RimP
MAVSGLAAKLTGLLGARASEDGLEVYAVEVAGPVRTPIVRVYLDREGGIDIEAIAQANSWIKDALDALPETAAGYDLEVSSPGIERPLVTAEHYLRYLGSQASITTREPLDGRKGFTGTIVAFEDDDVVLDTGDTTHRIPLGAVEKARLRVEIDLNKEGLDGI